MCEQKTGTSCAAIGSTSWQRASLLRTPPTKKITSKSSRNAQWWLPRLSYRRELFVLSDRGLVALDWVNEDQPGPVVLLAGGGFTDSQSRPWRALVPALTALGFPCVVVNGRGCGGVPLTTHRITYAASVSDFAEVVAEVRKRYPEECLLGVGVSLGGLQLALYLCQWGPRAQLDAAVAVSPPFQMGLASRNQRKWGTNILLNIWITRRFVGCLRENQEVVRSANVIRADNVFNCWTLASFNKHYAAPVFGFASVEDFYENCSLKEHLERSSRPAARWRRSGRVVTTSCLTRRKRTWSLLGRCLRRHVLYDKAIGCMNSVGAKLNSCWRTFRGHMQKAVVKAPITGVLPHTCCAYHDLVSCADQSLTPCESTGGKELSVGVLERAFGDAVNLVCGEHTKGSEACKALPKLPALGASDRKIDNYIELLAEAAVTFGRKN
ncbi:protein abhd-3.2-like [Dermacentor silvarum]|uniref:protein abhd-3.2-like n=1 Tax=Dermacentor silvarum TaxID=543639 RepID=UPI00210191A6|nr:protein abhd-3.2-like [Dermacentor silvarum]